MPASLRRFALAASLALTTAAITLAPAMEPAAPGAPLPLAPPENAAEALSRRAEMLPVAQLRDNVTLLTDGFEGTFPGSAWTVLLNNGATNAVWGRTTAAADSGSVSVHCAAAGNQGIVPGQAPYPPFMGTWMMSGPFNLADATAATFDFRYNSITEQDFDYFYVIITNDPTLTFYDFYSQSGSSNGWQGFSVDLAAVGQNNYLGQQAVYVGFAFTSDELVGDLGTFVDNVSLVKVTNSGTPSPTPTPIPTPTVSPSPSPTNATPSPSLSPSPTPSPSPTTPPGGEDKTFTIFNDGTATLQVSGISKQNNSSWLTVIPPSNFPLQIPVGGTATVTARVNKTGLANGNYSDRLLIASNDPDENPYPTGVFINLTVGTGPTPSPTPTPTPTTTPNPTPTTAPNMQAIIDRLAGSGSGGTDANSDGIIDSADVRRATP